MKNNIIFVLFLFLLTSIDVSASNNSKNKIKEYDRLFNQIGKKRVGVSKNKIDTIKNPFIMINNNKVVADGNNTITHTISYVLNATFDKKAKINGKWYKLNSDVDNFKLVKIGSKSVIIKNEHSKKELFIRKNDVNKIKFSSK